MRAVILERIDHRHRILIKCQERCRDAIWWSNFSQAGKRNVFSLQEAQTLWALWISHHSSIGSAPLVNVGKLLWWLKNSRVQITSVSKVFQFVCHANNVVALWPQDRLPKRVKSASNSFHIRKLFCTISRGQRRMFASCRSCRLCVFPTVSLFHKPLTLEAKTEKQDFLKTEASEAETTHLHATCNPPSGPILCKEITKKQNKGWDYNCVFIFGALKKTAFKEENTYSQN